MLKMSEPAYKVKCPVFTPAVTIVSDCGHMTKKVFYFIL